MDTGTPWHYLRPNDSMRYPRRHITFDTEARVTKTRRGETHRFRCGVVSFDVIDRDTLDAGRSQLTSYADPAELWRYITDAALVKERTIVWAHNLAYDLRISQAFELLPAMGWTLAFLTLDSQRCVARWVNGKRSLVMTDLVSWLPTTLEKIGASLGLRKPRLPEQDASDSEWLHRCQQDVRITRAAVLWLIRYLEENDLGSFRYTGPAQSMAAYRHRFLPRQGLLVHRDEEILAAERTAAWTGRCEVFRHGEVNEPLEEWDFELAYLTLAKTLELPVRLAGYRNRLSVKQLAQYSRRYHVLVSAQVEASAPCLPATSADRILWPIGKFHGCYWDNELLAGASHGSTVLVERAWFYRKAPVLAEWATWLLAKLVHENEQTAGLEKILLKHWARALIGRFGLRYPQLSKSYTLPVAGIEYVPGYDIDSGTEYAELQVGTDVLEKSGMVESNSSMPSIMSYIMAAARVRMLQAIEAAGEPNVFYVDTDSLLVNAAGAKRLKAWSQTEAGTGLRRKAKYTSAILRAPRCIILDDTPRVAGMPRAASANGNGSYTGEVWEGLAESLRHGRPNEVRINERRYRLRGIDHRRRHLKGGQTAPFVVGL